MAEAVAIGAAVAVTGALTGAVANTVLNRVVPAAGETIREKLRRFFYANLTVTLGQNKAKFLNIVKFLTEFPQFRYMNSNSICVDGQEYIVPTGKVAMPIKGYKFTFFVGTDMNANISYVHVSTWRRKMFSDNVERLTVFGKFLDKFPSTADAFNPRKLATKIIAAMTRIPRVRFVFGRRGQQQGQQGRQDYQKLDNEAEML